HPISTPSATAPHYPHSPSDSLDTCERLSEKHQIMGSTTKEPLHIQECIAAAIRCLEACKWRDPTEFTNNQLEAEPYTESFSTNISQLAQQRLSCDPLKYSVLASIAARYALRQILSDVECELLSRQFAVSIANCLMFRQAFFLSSKSNFIPLAVRFQQTSATLSSIAPLFSPNENGEENPDPSLIHFRFVFHMVNVLFLMNTGKAYEARQALMRLQDVVTKSTVPIDNNGMVGTFF
ncbi:hypothetical protein BC829DRAFT_393621, partial [Chytridium lagenaria]